MRRVKTLAVLLGLCALLALWAATAPAQRPVAQPTPPATDRGVDRSTLDFQNQLLCTQAVEEAGEPDCVSVEYQGLEPGTRNGVAAYRTTYKFHLADGSSMLFTGWFRQSDGKYLEYVSLTH